MPFGVDEAGKGPVFGSMFAACVRVDDRSHLPDGIADSKRLAPARREALAEALRSDDRVRIGLAEVPPERIDEPATDMNGLAVEAHAAAIEDALGDEEGRASPGARADGGGASPPRGICDACDTDADRFARRVVDACAIDVTVDARHGADDDDPLAGAASVIAKVARDAHVAAIAEEYGDVGSGYPSDPTTRDFLEAFVADRGELPPFARASWSTCRDVLATVSQSGLDEFGD